MLDQLRDLLQLVGEAVVLRAERRRRRRRARQDRLERLRQRQRARLQRRRASRPSPRRCPRAISVLHRGQPRLVGRRRRRAADRRACRSAAARPTLVVSPVRNSALPAIDSRDRRDAAGRAHQVGHAAAPARSARARCSGGRPGTAAAGPRARTGSAARRRSSCSSPSVAGLISEPTLNSVRHLALRPQPLQPGHLRMQRVVRWPVAIGDRQQRRLRQREAARALRTARRGVAARSPTCVNGTIMLFESLPPNRNTQTSAR